MSKKILFLYVLFMSFAVGLQAQELQQLLQKINSYHDQNPNEKIYLHLDKQHYSAGETLWFKAYTTVGVANLPSNISGIAYIELISPREEIVSSLRIPLVSGLGMGDISLADTLIEGTYRLRAYTNWMKNDSSCYFFDENIQISNGRLDNVLTTSRQQGDLYTIQLRDLQSQPLNAKNVQYSIVQGDKRLKRGRITTNEQGEFVLPIKEDYAQAKLLLSFTNATDVPVQKIFKLPAVGQAVPSIQFFPEGGQLLVNSINKIAVKSIKPDGLGIASQTYILSVEGDTVASIHTNSLGMGSSPLYVHDTIPLLAHTTFEDGSSLQSELPRPMISGYGLQVNNEQSDKLFAQVNLSSDKLDQEAVYFVVQHLGKVYYASKQPAAKKELVFSVPKAGLPNGVLTISILNSQLRPVVERAIFSFQEEQQLPLQLHTDAESYGTRKKVQVRIQAVVPSDSLKIAALSASVVPVNKQQIQPKTSFNILSSLLLSADIHGFIEQPGYYFDGEVKNKDIDDLLLTQGWRKIEISDTLTARQPAYRPEKNISINGQVRKLGRKAPVPHAKMLLVPTHHFSSFIDTLADEEGNFSFDKLHFPDSIQFLVTAKDQKGKNNIDIIIPAADVPIIGRSRNAPAEQNNINGQYVDVLQDAKKYFTALEGQGLMEKTIAIEEVVVTANRSRSKASERSANLNGPGNADHVISAEELEDCVSLDQCLFGIMGLEMRGGIPYSTRGGGEMQVVMDGMYVESDMLSMINPMDVQSIEILRNVNYTAIYGSYGANGLLIITSKTGADAMRSNSYKPKGIVTVQPQGLYVNRRFYKPVYEVDSPTQLQQDLRMTIHWEPNIVTDQQGRASFDFYTSDETGTYLISLEGLDFHGRLGRVLQYIQVE